MITRGARSTACIRRRGGGVQESNWVAAQVVELLPHIF